MLLSEFLDRLEGVKRNGPGWTARCPAHDDQTASLSVAEGADGMMLLKCHAGCGFEQILAAVASLMRAHSGGIDAHLHTPRGKSHSSTQNAVQAGDAQRRTPVAHPEGFTLVQYAALKGFPVDFLKTIDVIEAKWDGAPAVAMKYLDTDGQVLTTKYRIAASGDKMRNARGRKVALYGLNRLTSAREAGYVILPEGESCTQTLWLHEYPALGLPSATGWRDDRDLGHVEGIDKLYVIIEADSGGQRALDRWAHSTARDRVALVRMPDGLTTSASFISTIRGGSANDSSRHCKRRRRGVSTRRLRGSYVALTRGSSAVSWQSRIASSIGSQ